MSHGVFLQQMPYLLMLELVLSHQTPDDPKTLIIYSLLLKGNIICRADLTVTPGIRLFHCYFLASTLTTCINYSLVCISVLGTSYHSNTMLPQEGP